ncbi:MAG: pyruvate dehydrogenase complex dihydrolipoamide acetyltransferase [Hyphomonadaceae bacterium]|nr:pyruvate dehydrogenase complex dihydrolipoamide acetyltransferase [Hyphomonadaceae bacterium]
MSTQITMPALSPTMEEGNLAKWHVKVGDTIEPGQVIAEIETDKATMEVEAVDEGVIEELLVAEGTQGVKVNTPIARLKGDGAENPAAKAAHAPAAEAKKEIAPPKAPPQASPTGTPATAEQKSRTLASPLARRLAAQGGIDLAGLKGSGPNGRVVKADIEASAGATSAQAPQHQAQPAQSQQAPPAQAQPSREVARPSAAKPPARSLEQMGIPSGSYDLVPLDMMRKTIARRMTDSFRDIPHFPLTIDIEIDGLLKARADINKRFAEQGVKISVNDMCIKAAALALKIVPEANASYTPDGIAMHHHADIAIAVAIRGGLITPIIRAAETKGLAQISHEMADLAERARTKKLKPEEFQGGTFSISNMGMMGIKHFASIINEPHGMIMSIGAGEKRPVVKNDALAIATVMTVTVTCDHRVVDGALGAAFLKAFKSFLEDPMAMLL